MANHLNPRLALTTTPNSGSDFAWIFSTVPNTSTFFQGYTYGWSAAAQGINQGWLPVDITTDAASNSGWWAYVDPNFPPPLAAALSQAFADRDFEPMVATRALSTTQVQLFLMQAGFGWYPFETPPLPNGDVVGNSIAIAETPPYYANQFQEYYEWISVVSTNHHMYKIRLGWDSNVGDWIWDGWYGSYTNYADNSTDSLSASWYTDINGANWDSFYLKTVTPQAIQEWVHDGDFGWRLLSPLPYSYTYLGNSSTTRYSDNGGISWYDDLFTLCAPSGGNPGICMLDRNSGGTSWNWILLPGP